MSVGRHDDAQSHIDDRVEEMHQNGQMMFMPEYLRVGADILAAKADAGAETAYLHAIDLAQKQSALAWELRATAGLARFYKNSFPGRARTILKTVYDHFSDGFETADLMAAKRLLDELA